MKREDQDYFRPFTWSDWSDELANSYESREFPMLQQPKEQSLKIDREPIQQEQQNKPDKKEPKTTDSVILSDGSIEIEDGLILNSFLSLQMDTKTTRVSERNQCNSQKIFKMVTKAHFCKNLPAELFRKLKNYLKKIGLQHVIDTTKKRFNIDEWKQFISEGLLTEQQWNEFINITQINALIDKSKKLGTSKHFAKISSTQRAFLIQLNKKAQKIVYLSVKRVFAQLLRGAEFVSYLDEQAQIDLHELDNQCAQSPKYSTEYQYFLTLLKE